MCGRYASFREAQYLADAFNVEEITTRTRTANDNDNDNDNDNVAPTDEIRIVLDRAQTQGDSVRREMHAARWGLLPPWAKELREGARLFNARSDAIATKPAFAKSLRQRRCIVVADGVDTPRCTESAAELVRSFVPSRFGAT